MELTLNIPEPIVSKLMERLGDTQGDLEELIISFLAKEAATEFSHDEWVPLNERREELIFKSNKTQLSSKEKEELARLQNLADRRLESLDSERVSHSNTLLEDAKALLGVED